MANLRSKPIYPPVYLLLSVLVMIGLHFVFPIRQVLRAPYRYSGVLLIVLGVGLVLWAAGLFRRAETTIKPFETSTALVLRGPYRVSRNPIYVGMVGALVGVALLAGSITPFLIVPAFAVWIDWRFIRREEVALERTFGAEYRAYQSRVRRWL